MKLECERASIGEIDEIKNIYTEAQQLMEAEGNPQWPKGFPDRDDLREAIYGGVLYAVRCDGTLAAVFSAMTHDGDYDEIEGKWLTEGSEYLAVHRVAVKSDMRGRGIAKFIVTECAPSLAREFAKGSIRMDTHRLNVPMRSLLEKCGFSECGRVTKIRDDTERIAYEKLL